MYKAPCCLNWWSAATSISSNLPKRSRSPGLLSSRLQSPSCHATIKLSPLRMSISVSSRGGTPGFLLVPSVTVMSQADGIRDIERPHFCLGADPAGPSGVAWGDVRHHVPPCWSARRELAGRCLSPRRVSVPLWAGRG